MRERLKTHFRINTRLSMMSDKNLKALLSKAKLTKGWGQNGVVELDGQKIFVKKIPLTDLELANAYSTKNLYKIPCWYSYGVGSAGFGAFRELAANIKTTNWVRSGEFTAFPLLHHYRIVDTNEGSPGIRDLKRYVAHWNGSKTVERYMLDRQQCQHHLVLFLEHLTPLSDWIIGSSAKVNRMFPKALKTIEYLKQNGIIHLDAHLYNWLTDGRELFLADFGLLLDREFELTESELKFFKDHVDYDYAHIVETFGVALAENYLSQHASHEALVEKQLDDSSNEDDPYTNLLIRTLLTLHEEKQIRLPAGLVRTIRRYQPIINVKNDFFRDIYKGKKTVDIYPARKLRKLLRQAEILD